jgi:hypothetical protein
MTGNIWMDLQMSLADIGAEISDMSGEPPPYLPRVMQWANVGLGERSTMRSTSTACLAVRALSRPWPRGRFPDAGVHLAG